jgi:AGZA family xanthine/uracil permease-like MFS transporter
LRYDLIEQVGGFMETETKKKSQFRFAVERFFKFEQRKATWKKELLGGFTAFLALIYMINVESSFTGLTGANSAGLHGTFLITCLVLGVGSIAVGFCSNTPTLATPAMGLNAMFAFNIANTFDDKSVGITVAMLATMLSSVLLVIICYTKLLTFILKAIPQSLSIGITVAFGFFIMYVGSQLNGMIWHCSYGMPVAGHDGLKTHWPGIIIGMSVIFCILLFHFKKIPGGVAVAMIVGLIITVIVANTVDSTLVNDNFGASKWVGWKYAAEDLDFTYNFTHFMADGIKSSKVWSSATIYLSIFLFSIIALFNISGASYVIIMDDIAKVGTPEFDHEVKKQLRVMSAISVGTAAIGCSPIVNALETKAGMGQGSRTGVAAIFSGILYLAAIALLPIFKMIPSCITGAASIYIGFLMVANISNIEWKKPEFWIAMALMIVLSVVTYNIVDGIAVGFIAYALVSLFTGKAKQVSITMWILAVLFVAYFVAIYFQL